MWLSELHPLSLSLSLPLPLSLSSYTPYPVLQVDMYCELLNEHISAERYRTAGAGCGRGDNTPYIRDTALISFRHSFALNVQV